MKPDAFAELLEQRIQKIRDVLATKAVDYASAGDRLHNFKSAGAITRRTPAQALVGMWVKHVVSVLDIVEKNADKVSVPYHVIDEKIGDAINYLILLEAVLVDSKLVGDQ